MTRSIKVLILLLVVFAVTYFNLTPFGSVDCWWHMKMAEKFLETGSPVIYDSFAVQTPEKIVATYPNLLPGILFVKVFELASFQGLNVLRISLFILFIAFLVILAAKSARPYFLLVQVVFLAWLMHSWVILQPDLFNYLFFSLWIYLLEKLVRDPGKIKYFFGLIVLEMAWVNTHPLFFYYGLFIALIYLGKPLLGNLRSKQKFSLKSVNQKTLTLVYFLSTSLIWLFNPLGWRALKSLFVNMIGSDFQPESTRSLLKSVNNIETWGYLLLLVVVLAGTKLLKDHRSTAGKWNYLLLVIIFIPVFFFERVLPFLFIYMIMIQLTGPVAKPYTTGKNKQKLWLAVVLLSSLFLVLDRNQLLSAKGTRVLNNSLGLSLVYISNAPGARINELHPIEAFRELSLINSLAVKGNLFSNHLPISSGAVWFCPDKPVYWYGHAAVADARYQDMKEFLLSLPLEDQGRVKGFLEKYDIQTVVLTNYNSRYFKHYSQFHRYLQLVYIDPFITVFLNRSKVNQEQVLKINHFYQNYLPTYLDKMRFNPRDQAFKYLLLWLGAELTKNNGERFLNEGKKFINPATVKSFIKLGRRIKDSLELPAP